MKHVLAFAAAAASVVLVAAPASAAVTFDPATGSGFVGKGDVQLALGMNNKELQDAASSLQFDYSTTTTISTTWTCDRDGGSQTQERANNTTTSVQGVVNAVSRVKSQVTGFTLSGYGSALQQTATNDGPAVGSCPTFWTAIDLEVGEPVVTGGSLTVNGVPLP